MKIAAAVLSALAVVMVAFVAFLALNHHNAETASQEHASCMADALSHIAATTPHMSVYPDGGVAKATEMCA